MTILMIPATPAAAWVWPRFDFTEPSHSGSLVRRGSVRMWRAGLGPRWGRRGPCRCRAPRRRPLGPPTAARSPGRAQMTRCWDGPLGAVRPLLAPSWLTAEPRTTARTRWPLRRASDRRSTRSMPAPSDQPVPSAASANDLQRPSLAQTALPAEVDEGAGGRHHGDAAREREGALALAQRLVARCSATRDDEHAVSTVTAGPSRPST